MLKWINLPKAWGFNEVNAHLDPDWWLERMQEKVVLTYVLLV